jgi:hypothetical protein
VEYKTLPLPRIYKAEKKLAAISFAFACASVAPPLFSILRGDPLLAAAFNAARLAGTGPLPVR